MAGIRSRHLSGGQWENHEIDDKPLTFICHKGDHQIDVPDAIEMNFDVTRYHGNRVEKIDPIALSWIEFILGYELERDLQPSDRPDSQAHVIGLVDLPIKLMQKAGSGLPIFFKEPETSLHPSQQVNVTNFLVALTNDLNPETGEFTTLPDGFEDKERQPWSV
jgi:hypothetical protein